MTEVAFILLPVAQKLFLQLIQFKCPDSRLGVYKTISVCLKNMIVSSCLSWLWDPVIFNS